MREASAAAVLLLLASIALPTPTASAQSLPRDVGGRLVIRTAEPGRSLDRPFIRPLKATNCGPGRKPIGSLCVNVAPTPCPSGHIRRNGRCTKATNDIANPGSISLPCPKGQKRLGKRCVEVATPQPCPPGRIRVRGDCIKSTNDVANPDGTTQPCPKGHRRQGKRCILVGTSDPPVVTFPEGGCDKGYQRRGKRCVAVDPPSSPPPAGPPVAPPKVATPPPVVPPPILALTANRPHRPREILVLLPTANAPAVTTELMRRHSLVAADTLPIILIDATLVRFTLVDNRPLEQVLAALAGDSSVLAVQPNYRFEASEAPAAVVKRYPQYAPAKMRIAEAHAIAKGRGVKLAIIDTGIDETHPEIAGAVVDRFDSLREGAPKPEAHGTAITGLISARISLEGIAPEARVLSVRAFASSPGGPPQSTSLALIRAIDWAFATEARLFNMSFAGPQDGLLGKVIAAAAKKGAIFVAAAGNGGPDAPPAYPGAYPDVIAVTATDEREQLFSMAQRGEHIAIAAPGVDVLAPAPGAAYDISSGTSIAAAHVTGVIALILQRDPGAPPEAVRAILKETARKPDTADARQFGAGHIDAERALASMGAHAELD